jgi:hypothetical protein
MYRNVLLLLGLTLPVFTLAQKTEQSYCDMAKAPRRNDCFNIKDNGIKDSSYYKNDEWWAGNCKIKVSSGIGTGGSSTSISGSWLKRMVQDIIDVCDSGFKYRKGVRVDVVLCTIGQQGINVECASPLKKVGGFPEKKKKRDTPAVLVPSRRHLTDIRSTQSENPSRVLVRASEPYPGIICGGGPFSARIDGCKTALNDLKAAKAAGKKVTLPYKKEGDDCTLHVWPITRDKKETEVSHIIYSMEEDMDLCADKTKKIIGMVSNYNGYGYHMFIGQFCGALGTGGAGSCYF